MQGYVPLEDLKVALFAKAANKTADEPNGTGEQFKM